MHQRKIHRFLDDYEMPPPVATRDRHLVYGVVGPPLAWATHLAFVYGLSYPVAPNGSKVALYGVSLACLSLTAQGISLGSSELHRLSFLAGRAPVHARTELLAKSVLVLGTFFTLVILAQTLPLVFLCGGD